MAEDKKSFILYSDSYGLIKQLPDEIAGRLFKHIFAYVNDENPKSEDLLLNIAFEPIKNQLKRDLQKWDKNKIDKSINGRMGNLKRYNLDIYNDVILEKLSLEDGENLAKSRKTSLGDTLPSLPIAKLAVNDNVNVNVNDNVIKVKKLTKEIDYSFLQNEPTILIDAFEKWLKYKKEIKNPYNTQTSTQTVFNHLKELSGLNFDNAMKIVNNSIANQYKGLFALPKTNQPNQPLQNVSPPSQYKRHEL